MLLSRRFEEEPRNRPRSDPRRDRSEAPCLVSEFSELSDFVDQSEGSPLSPRAPRLHGAGDDFAVGDVTDDVTADVTAADVTDDGMVARGWGHGVCKGEGRGQGRSHGRGQGKGRGIPTRAMKAGLHDVDPDGGPHGDPEGGPTPAPGGTFTPLSQRSAALADLALICDTVPNLYPHHTNLRAMPGRKQ